MDTPRQLNPPGQVWPLGGLCVAKTHRDTWGARGIHDLTCLPTAPLRTCPMGAKWTSSTHLPSCSSTWSADTLLHVQVVTVDQQE